MSSSPTSRSTLPLSEVARHIAYPSGIVSSGWAPVRQRCKEFGVTFDAWQSSIGTLALGKRADGKYAATVGGVTLSIPRQTGKTYLIAWLAFALCTLVPGLKVLWTAHRTRTATQTFRQMAAMAKRSKVIPFVESVRATNGEQEIRFRNGSTIMFGAREQGFGRGFDSVDIEVFDEAQILTEKALEDMVPAANASKQPTGALLFFMGTPPRPIDPGEEFTRRREKALAGDWDEGVYVEFSADEDANPDDLAQLEKANPSFPDRTPLESIQRMRANLTDVDSFMREAFGIWETRGGPDVIDARTWAQRGDSASQAVDDLAVAVDVSPDSASASVALAGLRADGRWHIELAETRAGTGWVVPWLEALLAANDGIRAVVVDGGSAAAALLDEMGKRHIRPTISGAKDMALACARFYTDVNEDNLRHTEQPQLTAALHGAKKRQMLGGNAWGWSRKNTTVDITPLVAATLALWGAQQKKVKTPGRGGGKRKGLVL